LHDRRAIDEVLVDIDRDRFMTAAEGVEYGLIDRVMAPTKASQRAA
jgi:ATP-dependent Clp protease, protease subunit